MRKMTKKNKIQSLIKAIKSSIRKFNINFVASAQHDDESRYELQRILLDKEADIDILKSLCENHEELPDLQLQVDALNMKGHKFDDVASSKASETSANLSKVGSITSPKAKLQSAQLELELGNLEKQAALQQKLAEIHLETNKQKIISKQKGMRVKQDIVEENDLDEWKEVEKMLHDTDIDMPHVTIPPQASITTSYKTDKHSVVISTNGTNNEDLAYCITKAIQANNIPKPPIFHEISR